MALLATTACSTSEKITYPQPPSDATADNYFGTEVPDPYRPLENDTAPATLAWVEAEREITENYLDKIPFRNSLRKQITDFNNFTRQGTPWKWYDGKYYFSRNDGLKNQAVIYRSSTPDGKDAEVFLDPNTLSDDGTVALTGLTMSHDGKYVAYTISRSGSDWTEIFVVDAATAILNGPSLPMPPGTRMDFSIRPTTVLWKVRSSPTPTKTIAYIITKWALLRAPTP